ncbi:MAG: purine-binding chemotaxis protein CheW [Euryarchaeota archaeon]|nr:purine-binding chemotaxis protein CheW [Euryarchaeota archaeon]
MGGDAPRKTDSETGAGTGGEEVALVVFRLGAEEFGAPVLQVREILKLESVTRVPRADPEVEGVMNLRGQILTVIDLRRRLGFDARPPGMQPRVIVVQNPGSQPVGLVVDEVTEVLRVGADSLESTPPLVLTEQSQRYLRGVAKIGDRLIILCDISALVTPSVQQKSGAGVPP